MVKPIETEAMGWHAWLTVPQQGKAGFNSSGTGAETLKVPQKLSCREWTGFQRVGLDILDRRKEIGRDCPQELRVPQGAEVEVGRDQIWSLTGR